LVGYVKKLKRGDSLAINNEKKYNTQISVHVAHRLYLVSTVVDVLLLYVLFLAKTSIHIIKLFCGVIFSFLLIFSAFAKLYLLKNIVP
jgi:hypothetical protein